MFWNPEQSIMTRSFNVWLDHIFYICFIRGYKIMLQLIAISDISSLRSRRDFAHECIFFGSEALNASGQAVRGLVKSRVEFPPAQIRGVF